MRARRSRSSDHGLSSSSQTTLPAHLRERLGEELQVFYAYVLSENQPRHLLGLVAQLSEVLDSQDAAYAETFRDELLAVLPRLRAFAVSLAMDEAQADDLVQETVIKAWQHQESYRPGVNVEAWICTILRRLFYADRRTIKREAASEFSADPVTTPPTLEQSTDLRKIWVALTNLPPVQREALVLVSAQGMTYEAAATRAGCQVGTIKSRVSRARAALAGSLGVPALRLVTGAE
ncbi:sigma-70 family RNA polymerase sigma factor [Methylobacterium durans]|uniref:RNA polymerase sigma factor n=1 Tax=Methylobacterium durans TaxID=2202825 RepID=A0A2U8WB83_9HYPH|nr:sigma-70 family RNA polymerase sigma factor [Methylobacterium durans]AWN42851.1 RNA polymerase subunit sigma-70 [Methylobacterium durans]